MWLPEPAPAVPAVAGVGLRLQPLQQFLQRFGRNRVLADDDHRIARQQHHRLEIGHEVVAELVDRAVGDVGAEMAETDGVAVGRRAHRASDPDRAARPGHVLDQHGFAERRLHALGQDPRHRIRRPAGGERHDDGDRDATENFRRSALPPKCQQRSQRGQNCSSHYTLHQNDHRRHCEEQLRRKRSSQDGHTGLGIASRLGNDALLRMTTHNFA